MEITGGIGLLLTDHFKPFKLKKRKNEFKWLHFSYVLILPIALAVTIGAIGDKFVTDNFAAFIAIYAIMAAVMTAIMPTINSIVGPIDRERVESLKTGDAKSDDNITEAEVLIAKVEVVRGLYGAVGWSVLILCLALLPLMGIGWSAFHADLQTPPIALSNAMHGFRIVLSMLIAFSGCASLLSLLQIVGGVHLLLRHSQIDVEKNLDKLREKYNL